MPEPTLFTKMLAQEANRLLTEFESLESVPLPDHGFDRITFSRLTIASIYPNNRSIGFFVPREAFERSLYAFSQQWLRLPIQWLVHELQAKPTMQAIGRLQVPNGMNGWVCGNIRLLVGKAPPDEVSEKSLPVISSWFQPEEHYRIETDRLAVEPVCPVIILTVVVEDVPEI